MSEIRIHLVRHGEAAAGFGSHRDPGLSERGWEQARRVAQMLAQRPPMALFSSPLARARETAVPLAETWQANVAIETRVAEIPSPTTDLVERSAWLSQAMQGTWSELDSATQAWRQDLLDWMHGVTEDCIVFSHYVAINAAVGIVQGDDRMRVFAPDNCSVTTIVGNDRGLAIERLGASADTHIN